MISNIIHREVIALPEKQLQMLRSGWGTPAIDDTIVEAIIYNSDGHQVHGYLAYPQAFAVALTAGKTTEHTETTEGGGNSNKTNNTTETTEKEFTKDASGNSSETLNNNPSVSSPEGTSVRSVVDNKLNINQTSKNPSVGSVGSVVDKGLNITQTSNNPSVGSVGSVVDNNTRMAQNLLPCIIWNRGGSKERGAIDRFTAKGMFGQLASWGFVVFASMYRATFERDAHDEFGGSEVNDILNLMEIAKDIPFADTSRWAMEGWSRGGMMTYLALKTRHDVKAAIISGGITDVAECCTTVPRIQAAIQHVIETEGTGAQENRSAIHFADELPRECKYLIIHGTKDDTVPPTQALKITSRFLELGMHFRLVLLEEGDHFLKGKKKEVDQLRKEWLLKYV